MRGSRGRPFVAARGGVEEADTLSITIMEVIDNVVVVLVPGPMDAGVDDPADLRRHRGRVCGRLPLRLPRQPLPDRQRQGYALGHEYHGH
jgi:hypothetical protein